MDTNLPTPTTARVYVNLPEDSITNSYNYYCSSWIDIKLLTINITLTIITN